MRSPRTSLSTARIESAGVYPGRTVLPGWQQGGEGTARDRALSISLQQDRGEAHLPSENDPCYEASNSVKAGSPMMSI